MYYRLEKLLLYISGVEKKILRRIKNPVKENKFMLLIIY